MVLSDRQSRAIAARDAMEGGGRPAPLVPRTFIEAQAFCGALATSDLIPQKLKDRAADVLVLVLAGMEIGLTPLASIRLHHVIEGVPRLSADGMAAIVMTSGECDYLECTESTELRCTWITKRRGRPERSCTWTIERAKRAGLTEKKNRDGSPGMWVKYPENMLSARAKAELCRLVYPDVVAGLVSREEAHDRDFIDAEFTESKPAFVAPPAGSGAGGGGSGSAVQVFTKDPATGILYSGPVKPPAEPAGETKAEYDARTGTVRNTTTDPAHVEAPKRGPGRPPKNETVRPPTGGGEYRPTTSADLPAPSPRSSGSTSSAPAGSAQQTATGSSSPTVDPPRPTTTPPAASGSGASSPASDSPTTASSSTASSGPTASAETSSAANGAASGESDDGFGADDPVDVVPSGGVEAKIAEFRAWVADCKSHRDLAAGFPAWRAWTVEMAKGGDTRFEKKGELTAVMQDLYGKRKGEVPA